MTSSSATERQRLRADCSNCAALCCVAPGFAKSDDFAFDKQPACACPNLSDESFGCTIHDELRPSGMTGCTAYDCFGAGQKVTQVSFSGFDWRAHPDLSMHMFATYVTMQALHELLWYMGEASGRIQESDPDLARTIDEIRSEIDQLTDAPATFLETFDVTPIREAVDPTLLLVSERVRAMNPEGADHRGADLSMQDLRGVDLSGANLRGCVLMGSDLRGADLRNADLLSADLRNANLRGADLTGAIYLIESQLDVAYGDATTKLPPEISPSRWWEQADAAAA